MSGDGNDETDVFVRDLALGVTTRVSVDTDGGDPDHSSSGEAMSSDGRVVAFSSQASDLIVQDRNGEYDVFLRDLVGPTT